MLNGTGPAVDQLILLGLAALLLAAGLLVLRVAPRLGFVAWLSSMCFVPYWLAVPVGPFLPPGAVVGVVVLAALVPYAGRRMSLPDVAVVLLLVLGVGLFAVGASTLATVFLLVTQWCVGFALGRLLPTRVGTDWTYRCLGVVFTAVACLALVEFVTGTNVFVGIGSSEWTGLQERGGRLRAEGAFGHSIALGASLALVIPLVLASGFALRTRLAMVLLMLAATALTFSRIGMVAAAAGVVLTVLFGREGISGRLRALITAGTVVAGVLLIPLIDETFAAAGDEATGSAAYRTDLLSLAGDIKVLGLTDAFYRAPTGEVYYGGFRSIDSALVLFALNFGWLPLVLVGVLLVGALALTVARRATAPTIAIAAQVPALMTVALITQYGMFLWFVAGLAVLSQLEARATAPSVPPDGTPDGTTDGTTGGTPGGTTGGTTATAATRGRPGERFTRSNRMNGPDRRRLPV